MPPAAGGTQQRTRRGDIQTCSGCVDTRSACNDDDGEGGRGYRIEAGSFANENLDILSCEGGNGQGQQIGEGGRRQHMMQQLCSAARNSPASDAVPKPLPMTATHTPPYLPHNHHQHHSQALATRGQVVTYHGAEAATDAPSDSGAACERSMASTALASSLKFLTNATRSSPLPPLLTVAACNLMR